MGYTSSANQKIGFSIRVDASDADAIARRLFVRTDLNRQSAVYLGRIPRVKFLFLRHELV
jgi:hypothetical protein